MSKSFQSMADSDKLLTFNSNVSRRERKLKRFLKIRQMNEKNSLTSLLGVPDLSIKIKNDYAALHSLLLSVHCMEFPKWLERHKCNNLPASVDLSTTHLSKDGIRKMIEYIYEEGKLQMDEISAEATLIAASYFRMVGLRKLIEQYSLQLVSQKTTFLPKWLKIADSNEVDPIYKNDLLYIASCDFQTLIKLKDATRLPDSVVIDLLHREDLNIDSEFNLYEFVLHWLVANSSPEGRRRAFQILSAVRFTTMSTETKLKCLDMAERAGIVDLLKPHMIMSDWQKIFQDYNHPYNTNLTKVLRTNTFPQHDTEQRCPWSREPCFPESMVMTKSASRKELFKPRSASNPSDNRPTRPRSSSDPRPLKSPHRTEPDPLRRQRRIIPSPARSRNETCPSPPSLGAIQSPSPFKRRILKTPPNPSNKLISSSLPGTRIRVTIERTPAENWKTKDKCFSSSDKYFSSSSGTDKDKTDNDEEAKDVEVNIEEPKEDAEDGNISEPKVEPFDEENENDTHGNLLCLHVMTKEVNK